ncbi:MAG: AMP-binding protein [Aliishimia sp.]
MPATPRANLPLVSNDEPHYRKASATPWRKSYGQRLYRGGQIAGWWVDRKGIRKKCTVALIAPNSPDYCVIFHAVAWAGGTITTINPTYTAAKIKHQLNDTSAEFLITDPLFVDVMRGGMTGTKVRAFQPTLPFFCIAAKVGFWETGKTDPANHGPKLPSKDLK